MFRIENMLPESLQWCNLFLHFLTKISPFLSPFLCPLSGDKPEGRDKKGRETPPPPLRLSIYHSRGLRGATATDILEEDLGTGLGATATDILPAERDLGTGFGATATDILPVEEDFGTGFGADATDILEEDLGTDCRLRGATATDIFFAGGAGL